MKIVRILPWLVVCIVYVTADSGWTAEPQQRTPQVVLPQLSGVTLNPSSVIGGATPVLGTVTLNQPAPSTGVMVMFRSSNPAVAAGPPRPLVQPGPASPTILPPLCPVAGNPN